MTIKQMIQRLQEAGVALPKTPKKKSFYEELCSKHLAKQRTSPSKLSALKRAPKVSASKTSLPKVSAPKVSATKVSATKVSAPKTPVPKTPLQKNAGNGTVKTARDAFLNLDDPAALDLNVNNMSWSYISVHCARNKHIETKELVTIVAKKPAGKFTNKSASKANVQLNKLVREFNLTLASEKVKIWPRLEEIIENLFGAKMKTDYIDVKYDRNWGSILEMVIYADVVVDPKNHKMKPSFYGLSEDVLQLQYWKFLSMFPNVVAENKEQAYVNQWGSIRDGMMARVWFSRIEKDEIRKLRIMLRFFPLPYQSKSRNVLALMNFGKSVCDGNTSETDREESCACNCACSTTLGMMLANEVGLLGTKVHQVLSKKHTYLAVGNRETDWKDHKVTIIETTARDEQNEDDCKRQLVSMYHIEEGNMYTKDDYLVPNLSVFYLENYFALWPRKMSLQETFIADKALKSSDIYSCSLLLRSIMVHFESLFAELERNVAFKQLVFDLIEKETKHPIAPQLGINFKPRFFPLVVCFAANNTTPEARAAVERLFNTVRRAGILESDNESLISKYF